MAISIRNIAGESAQKAFIDRVISRSDQIYPNTDHNVIRSVTGQLLDLTFGDLDLLADMLRVDVNLCSTQCRGRCDLLVGHDQRHLLLAHSSDLVTTNNNRKKAISK